MCRLAWSFTARICDKYINHKNKWPEPSFTSLLLIAISEGSGETAQMCSLARSFAARICDFFHELVHKFKPEPSSTSLHFNVFAVCICDLYQLFLNWRIKFGLCLHLHLFFLGICCSQLRLVPNCLELAYINWHQPS